MVKLKSNFKNEDGSSLVETLVAMAILVSVLLPTSLFLGYIGTNPLNEEKVIALGLAQAEIEQVLNKKSYSNQEKEVKNKWIVKNKISKKENLVHIEVFVFRKNKPEPTVTLNTQRLFYEDDASE